MTLTYLAVPYSHPDPAVREARFEAANRAAAKLIAEGRYVFSPISHSHPIALAADLPKDWDYWRGWAATMMSKCDRLVVLLSDGWQDSVGMRAEIKIAEALGIPVETLQP